MNYLCGEKISSQIAFEGEWAMKKKVLVLNGSSGISGDMTAAALLDLGADQKVLMEALDSLHLEGAQVVISRVKKSALDACDFNVILDESHENHDHDMAYLHPDQSPSRVRHGHGGHSHGERNQDRCGFGYEHNHDHHHHHHGRNLADIEKILRGGNLTAHALELAIRIFHVVAEAESKVHGEAVERVHFHEVGAVDSIIDTAAVAICLDNLEISDVIVTDLCEGTGTVMCQHGLLPVPVPATAQILMTHQIPFHVLDHVKGELITPTGAAIAAAIRTQEMLPDRFRIIKTGLGAGKREYATSGVLRAMLIEPEKTEGVMSRPEDTMTVRAMTGSAGTKKRDEIIKLETNIDDSTGEALGAVMELLLREGAKDVYYTSEYMKKHRPAYVLNVLCSRDKKDHLEEIIFRNTTTIGIREIICGRTVLPRKMRTIETPWGTAEVKVCRIGADSVAYPEAESVRRLSAACGIGYPEMYHKVKAFAQDIIDSSDGT